MGKTKSKNGGGKNRIPLISRPDLIADLRFALPFDAIPAVADRLLQFLVHKKKWQDECRAAFREGKTINELPVLAASKFSNPNKDRMSRPESDRIIDDYNEALEAGLALPASPPRYCPVEFEMVNEMGCSVIRRGQLPKQPDSWNEEKNGPWSMSVGKPGGIKAPKDWDEKRWGSWFHKDENGERTIPSGWKIDHKSQRPFHKPVDKMVENPSDNIVKINETRYVVAAGSKASEAAVYQMDCSDVGTNLGAIWDVRRRLCLAKTKGLTNLVWRIEDKPNVGSCVKIDMVGNGSFNFFMPGDSATPGYLTNGDGKEMTPAQVRKAAEDDVKGIKFKPLKEPIVGNEVSEDEAWPEIKKAFKGTTRSRTELNTHTQCRVSHDAGYPFGFRAASVAMVPCFRWSFDGNEYHCWMNLVIGVRTNAEHNFSKQEAKLAYHEAHPEVEEPEESEPKASKPKASKPKASKPKESAPEVVAEPAPIVIDTMDEADDDAVKEVDEAQRDLAEAEVQAAADEN